MFGSGVLDTAIGLMFVFFLVSMLVTIANEIISAALLSRAKWLRIGIDHMLGSDWAQQLYRHPLISGSAWVDGAKAPAGGNPSYIASRSFATVLLDLVHSSDTAIRPAQEKLKAALDGNLAGSSMAELRNRLLQAAEAVRSAGDLGAAVADDLRRKLDQLAAGYTVGEAAADLQRFVNAMPTRYLRGMIEKLAQEQVRRTLLVLLDDADNDIEKFKSNIETWFNNAMDRVGGWYKRKSQWVIAALSIGVAVVLNVDAVAVLKHLDTHPGVRDALVAQARAADANAPGTNARPDLQFKEVEAKLTQLSLPIGWVFAAPTDSEKLHRQNWPGSDAGAWRDTVLFHLVGWLLTALAATLGAPFWFDLLNRFISIRSTGKAPEEMPKPPKDVPVPLEPGQSPREADLVSSARRR